MGFSFVDIIIIFSLLLLVWFIFCLGITSPVREREQRYRDNYDDY